MSETKLLDDSSESISDRTKNLKSELQQLMSADSLYNEIFKLEHEVFLRLGELRVYLENINESLQARSIKTKVVETVNDSFKLIGEKRILLLSYSRLYSHLCNAFEINKKAQGAIFLLEAAGKTPIIDIDGYNEQLNNNMNFLKHHIPFFKKLQQYHINLDSELLQLCWTQIGELVFSINKKLEEYGLELLNDDTLNFGASKYADDFAPILLNQLSARAGLDLFDVPYKIRDALENDEKGFGRGILGLVGLPLQTLS